MFVRITGTALAVLAASAVCIDRAQADPLTLLTTIGNPSPNASDLFGQSVALDGGIALIGASNDANTGAGSGQAYLYNAATGTLLHTLANPTPAGNDFFGLSVSLSGNRALVGAQNDDTGGTNAGAAYLFNVATGALERTFLNPGTAPIASDNFGHSVAVHGNRALIAANLDDTGASNAGAAYLFDADTGALLQTFLNPTPVSGDQFGSTIALFGNRALIAAVGDDTGASNAGAAYLFDTDSGALLHSFTNPTPEANDSFGFSVALSANRVLIGANQDDTLGFNEGAAYLYDLSGTLIQTLLIPSQNGDSEFLGQSVALSGDLALVGAAFDNSAVNDGGGAYLFDAITGALLQEIFDPNPLASDRFGFAVALDSNGDGALVGAQTDRVGGVQSGSVFVYAGETAVSEPGGLALLGLGLAGLGALRWRSSSASRR